MGVWNDGIEKIGCLCKDNLKFEKQFSIIINFAIYSKKCPQLPETYSYILHMYPQHHFDARSGKKMNKSCELRHPHLYTNHTLIYNVHVHAYYEYNVHSTSSFQQKPKLKSYTHMALYGYMYLMHIHRNMHFLLWRTNINNQSNTTIIISVSHLSQPQSSHTYMMHQSNDTLLTFTNHVSTNTTC